MIDVIDRGVLGVSLMVSVLLLLMNLDSVFVVFEISVMLMLEFWVIIGVMVRFMLIWDFSLVGLVFCVVVVVLKVWLSSELLLIESLKLWMVSLFIVLVIVIGLGLVLVVRFLKLNVLVVLWVYVL